MLRRPLLLPALAALPSLLLVSCGEDPEERDAASTDEPTASSASSADPRDREEAVALLRAWRSDAIERETGTFRSAIPIPGAGLTSDGSYRLVPFETVLNKHASSPDGGEVVITYLGSEKAAAFTIEVEDEPVRECWIRIKSGDQTSGLGFELPPLGGAPSELSVLYGARIDPDPGDDPDEIRATGIAASILQMVGARALEAIDLPLDAEVRAPITIELQDGRIVGWRARLSDTLRSALGAGFASDDLPPAAFGNVEVEVRVDADGSDYEATRPTPSRFVDLVDPEFTAKMTACDTE